MFGQTHTHAHTHSMSLILPPLTYSLPCPTYNIPCYVWPDVRLGLPSSLFFTTQSERFQQCLIFEKIYIIFLSNTAADVFLERRDTLNSPDAFSWTETFCNFAFFPLLSLVLHFHFYLLSQVELHLIALLSPYLRYSRYRASYCAIIRSPILNPVRRRRRN